MIVPLTGDFETYLYTLYRIYASFFKTNSIPFGRLQVVQSQCRYRSASSETIQNLQTRFQAAQLLDRTTPLNL